MVQGALDGGNLLADEILFDLKSLLKEDKGEPRKVMQLARELVDEIDPDDPKRILRIS